MCEGEGTKMVGLSTGVRGQSPTTGHREVAKQGHGGAWPCRSPGLWEAEEDLH